MKRPAKPQRVKSLYVRGKEGMRRPLFGRARPCAPEEYAATPPAVEIVTPPPEPEAPQTKAPPSMPSAEERVELVNEAMNRLDMFHCKPLDCKLTRASCADRHVKGKACVVASVSMRGQVISPPEWAPYVPTCRSCPVGAATAKLLKIGAPRKKRQQ